ncbi:(R)-stereoselective amidase [Roseovarius gaetbuli]|uniref:(R)-stereoselective amidase n=1 Tax=Roseovarius gaetbuli TaxID=1356575 RepID=A0A1X7A935_9RHOB|nr:carbon-nitrogen hydrolase family protein [Roseovarius gaetbuli]SLN73144.1 (R)-stereoselective amidase [Roseovarius gaetbuli]
MADAILDVAVAQCSGALDGAEARLAWLSEVLQTRGGAPLDLIVLPELFQCGYNIGERVGARAEAPDGAFARAIADLAQTFGTAILYGYAERQGDQIFNAAQCIDRTGRRIGHHRKLLLPPGFEGDHFAVGDGCEVFELGGFTVATLVCYDVEFPENLRHVALAGADIVAVPTALGASWSVVSEKLVPTRAFENGVYLCYANYCGTENALEYFGGSCLIGPDGKDLARAMQGPALIEATLAKSAVSAAQARLPYHRDRLRLPWVT